MMLQWLIFFTIFKAEMHRVLRIWVQTIFPPFITTTLYFVIFGRIVGHRIGSMGGHSYVSFIAPGLIMMSILTSAFANTVGSFYITKYNKSIESMLISPASTVAILFGYMSGGVFRGLVVGVVVTLTALFFTHLHPYNLMVVFFSALIAASMFSLIGIINAVFAKSFNAISIIPTFVITPLIYIGGVFYSIQMLPSFWQKISALNPLVYIISAFRYGFIGLKGHSLFLELGVMLGVTCLLFAFAYHLIQKGVGLKS